MQISQAVEPIFVRELMNFVFDATDAYEEPELQIIAKILDLKTAEKLTNANLEQVEAMLCILEQKLEDYSLNVFHLFPRALKFRFFEQTVQEVVYHMIEVEVYFDSFLLHMRQVKNLLELREFDF